MHTIPVAKPYLPDEDVRNIIAQIRDVLESGMLMQGKFVEEFERAFSSYVGTNYAAALNSGTSALQAALDYFNIAGGEVLVPVNTFLASANAVIFAGGTPVFVEMDGNTLCMDIEDMKRCVTDKTKGIIVVHLAGLIQPGIEELVAFCKEKNLFLLEDASHAHGAVHNGKRAGSFGDAAAFSFLATKVMTTGGEGGIVTTNDKELMDRAKSLRFHGEDHTRGIQDRIGNSWRMTEIQAIVGIHQVNRLDEIVQKRARIGKMYDEAFSALNTVSSVPVPDGDTDVYYKYPLILDASFDRSVVKKQLEEIHGVKSGTSYWPPCHLQPAYRKTFGYKEGDYPIAEDVLNRTISLPLYCAMSDEEIEKVIAGVKDVCGG